MAKKKKLRRFTAVQAVKEMARERIGAPPRARVVPDKKTKPQGVKHKPKLSSLTEED